MGFILYLPCSTVGHRKLAQAVIIHSGVRGTSLLQGVCAQQSLQTTAVLRDQPLFLQGLVCVCRQGQDEVRLRRAESRPLWVYTVLGQPCTSHCLLVSGCLGTKTPRLLGTVTYLFTCLLYQTELCKGGNGISPTLASLGSSTRPGT